MNPPLLLASPVFVILFKWTCLLALGWAVHLTLRHRHARWRLILWRGILCFGVVMPLLQFFQIPGIKIPINTYANSANESSASISPATTIPPSQPSASLVQPATAKAVSNPAVILENFSHVASPPKHISWRSILIMTWALGFVLGTIRLFRLQMKLTNLRKETCKPTPEFQELASRIQTRLNIHKEVDVQISDAVISPFVCGLLKPTIILPQMLAQQLSHDEVSALLSHELAHLRQNDLMWCVAWRWMKALFWFHPLVWNVPAAHNLACEQEADRVASGQLEEQDSYARMLARLALRVLALPAVETKLTLNGSSQIARRLKHLGQKGMNVWNWKHSAAGFALAGLLFLIAAGCDFSNSSPETSTDPAKVKYKEVAVVVQDDGGKPITGATVSPEGFRVKGIHGADAYGWNKKLWGPPVAAVTDQNGNAMVKYPVMGIPQEKELTGALFFSVTHPEYATVRVQTYYVDRSEKPIQLTRGIHLEVSAYFGSDHQPVTDLVPNLNEEGLIHTNDWQKLDNGALAFHKMSPGGHILQFMGRLPSGEIVYSEDFAFTVEKGNKFSKQPNPSNPDGVIVSYQAGKEIRIRLNMQPGIRLEGRLDDNVPRPVKNGRVLISVRPKEFPAWNNYADIDDTLKKYPNVYPWKSYRPIAEDGTFVFESIPPGGLDVIVHGDGFVSKSGGDFSQRNGSKLEKVPGFALPQPFSIVAPTTKIEVVTEPTATLEVTAKTKAGKPVQGATVYVNPNVVMMGGIFGDIRQSSEEPYRNLPPLPDIPYFATTDKDGLAVIRNIPATDRGMDVESPNYQVPLQEPKGWRDRHIRTTFSPGMTNKFDLTLEPKGADFLGK